MKLDFLGETQGLEQGINILAKSLGFDWDRAGIPVFVERSEGKIQVSMSNGQGYIKFCEKIHFFRALGLFAEKLRESDNFSLEELPRFRTNGIMADVSRNAVMTVDTIKFLLEKMAVMGLNVMMLYTEDTYEIKSLPYFGYMRGRYTQEELAACDDFADIFGIEIIPCIQTLAHLSAALKWNFAREIRDTDDILLAGNEKTYEFIEEMIKAASAPFRSKRIHLGMDEAHSLGLGRYLEINGYKNRFDIMNQHLARVKDIAYKYGLSPMIWSDMYFRLASVNGDYYDGASIPAEVLEKVPKDVQLVYWDYYHNNENEYSGQLNMHKGFECDILFAGGIWTWNGIAVNYPKTLATTDAGLSACKKEGIREVFATIWGDNGAETNFLSALLGFQIYAEHGYAEKLDIEKLKKRFKFCTGGDFDAFMDLGSIDIIPGEKSASNGVPSNPSKSVLWQDILIGLYDKQIEDWELQEHYSEYEVKLKAAASTAPDRLKIIFEMSSVLASVLALKCEMGIKLKKAYDEKNPDELNTIADLELPMLKSNIQKLRDTHRTQWFETCKPFGWEVIDIRYGGVTARIETAIYRIKQYLSGQISRIEELEEERLYVDNPGHKADIYGTFNQYHRIASASPML